MSGRLHRDKQVGQVKSVSVHNRIVQIQRKAGDKQQEREGVSGIRRERRVDRRDGGEDGRVGNRKDSGLGGKGRQGTLLLNQKCDTDTKRKHHPPFSFPKEDPDLLSCMLPSHSIHLFTCLQSLREEGLLLDCTFPFQNNSFQAHRLVMASASQTPDAFFGLKQKPLLEVEEIARCLTPVGLRAVLDFSYCGDVVVDVGKDGIMEEVLNACKCLGMERLMSKCMSKVATSAAEEIEKSLTVIRDLWERGVGCDVTIQAESGEKYPAHRVVLAAGGDYFRALLCGGLRESSEDVVCLRGVASWVIESILGFIYTGQLRLGWKQIWDLTDALLQFQLQGALSLCIDFLRERMDENTCLDVLVLAETYGLVQLGRAAEEYILAHFQCISAGEKFKDVPYHLLNRLLEKDSLCIESEIAVFNAVVSWVEDNPKERLPFLPDLLLLVRLPLLTNSELKKALTCSLLRRSPGAKETLEIIRSLLNGDYRGPDCRPRTPNNVLVLVGGDTVDEEFMRRVPNQTLWYIHQLHHGPGLIRNIEWKPLAKLPEPARFRHSVCLLNNKLYILGGRMYYGSLDILKCAVRFDLTECKWERLPDMLCQRDYFSAVCLDGKVFALGGNRDDSQYLDAVEYYTPEENAWRRAHSLDTAICGHAAAVLDGQIYISGGCDLHQRCLPTMWHYHPSRGCSPRAPMTAGAGRAGHVMLALGRGLVVAGGLQPLWIGFGDQLLCELYDPKHDSWSSIPALPRPHLSPGATVLDGRLYVVGGSSADTARDTKWVHRYDPKEKCWEKLGAMPHPYTDLAACTLPLLHLND